VVGASPAAGKGLEEDWMLETGGATGMPDQGVLVVDDDPVVAATIAEILRSEGIPTTTAEDGIAALKAVEQFHPRLVLLDLGMPVFDGSDFARVVEGERSALKIVVISGAPDAAGIAAQLKADGYLRKPFDIERLLEEVRRHLDPQAA